MLAGVRVLLVLLASDLDTCKVLAGACKGVGDDLKQSHEYL